MHSTMINLLSALTAIAVYSRLCELGYGNGAAIVCGVCVGTLARYAFGVIKKSAGDEASGGQKGRKDPTNIYIIPQNKSRVKE